MASIENTHKWTLTSTGTAKAYDAKGYAQSVTFGLETSSGCTATVQILHRMNSSAGPYSVMSTVNLSTAAFTTVQFLGPLDWLSVRCSDKSANSTNTVTVYLKGN